MIRYIFKRFVLMIPVLLIVSFLVFFIMDLAPGDAAELIAGQDATVEQVEAVREEMGFNDPVLIRYSRYMWGVLRGNLGQSYLSGRDVFECYVERLPATVLLAVAGISVALLIAIPLGIVAALHRGGIADGISTVLALLGLSMPNFWLGLLLIIAFSLKLGLLPSFGMEDGWRSIILPAITVGTGQAAIIMRTTRSSMLEVISADYIRTARAKGVSKKGATLKHALRNALIPIITTIGVQLGATLGGAVLTEAVFSWPGIGQEIILSINNRDAEMATGFIIMTTMLCSLVILAVDILYAYVDPRIKAQYLK